jgi:hypothetical protein
MKIHAIFAPSHCLTTFGEVDNEYDQLMEWIRWPSRKIIQKKINSRKCKSICKKAGCY